MATAPAARTRLRAFSVSRYEAEVAEFHAEREEAYYQHLSGFRAELGTAPILARHAGLFERRVVDHLRRRVGVARGGGARERKLLAFATDGFIERDVAPLTDAIAAAESSAVVIWRGQRIGYRAIANRISEISGRTERNALLAAMLEVEEAINPQRARRLERIQQLTVELGYADYPELIAETRGFDPDALAVELRDFLTASETQYFAALRRHLARIEIEHGDATLADAWYLLRGAGFDHWFEATRLRPVLEATLAGLGLDLARTDGATLDLEPRPGKAPRAFVAAVRVPGDVRLVIQPHGGWDDYAAALHEAGHLAHFLHMDPGLHVPDRLLGEPTLTEGQAFVFEALVGDPAFLGERLGLPQQSAADFADFFALFWLYRMRRTAALLLSELRLHRSDQEPIQRAQYAGLVGLLTGIQEPQQRYLVAVDDGMYAAAYARAFMLGGSLSAWLEEAHGPRWWSAAAAGTALRGAWASGFSRSAEDAVASLGYDRLDWRPILRTIRAQLIGEMSGYGGPNITTRAGSRKV